MCNVLAHKFLAKYFPPAKTAKFRNDITTFVHQDNKSLYESQKHFRDLLKKCPHHDIPIWLQMKILYNGLGTYNHSKFVVTAGRALMNKTPKAAYKLLEELTSNNYMWVLERAKPRIVA